MPFDGKTEDLCSEIEASARHAGACEAIAIACRLLRASNMRDAADLIMNHVETITQTGTRS